MSMCVCMHVRMKEIGINGQCAAFLLLLLVKRGNVNRQNCLHTPA